MSASMHMGSDTPLISLSGLIAFESERHSAAFCLQRSSRTAQRVYILSITTTLRRSRKHDRTTNVASSLADANLSPTSMRKRDAKVIGMYELGKTLGEGEFAKVKLGVRIDNGTRVAVKIIEKNRISSVQREQCLRKELAILKAIDHEHIVKLFEVLSTPSKYYIILELCSGVTKGKFSEKEARLYFQQLIAGVQFMHENNICHRDLKPENLLLDSEGGLKISDFGFATDLHATKIYSAVGTPNYVAPEIIHSMETKDGYGGRGVDIWACGVILYVMLTGCFPFDAESHFDLFEMIVKSEVRYPSHLSPEAKQLIIGLMNKDPQLRYTIDDIKADDWFNVDRPPTPRAKVDSIEQAVSKEEHVFHLPEPKHERDRVGIKNTASPADRLSAKIEAAELQLSPRTTTTPPTVNTVPTPSIQVESASVSVVSGSEGLQTPVKGTDMGALAPTSTVKTPGTVNLTSLKPLVLRRILALYRSMSDRVSKETTFLTLIPVSLVMNRLVEAFAEMKAVFVVPYMAKVKAQFNKGQRSEVLIGVETIEMAPGVVLVEFNRRKGSPLAFHSVFGRVKELLQDIVVSADQLAQQAAEEN